MLRRFANFLEGSVASSSMKTGMVDISYCYFKVLIKVK